MRVMHKESLNYLPALQNPQHPANAHHTQERFGNRIFPVRVLNSNAGGCGGALTAVYRQFCASAFQRNVISQKQKVNKNRKNCYQIYQADKREHEFGPYFRQEQREEVVKQEK